MEHNIPEHRACLYKTAVEHKVDIKSTHYSECHMAVDMFLRFNNF